MANDPTDELQIRNLIARLAQVADTATEADLDTAYVPLFTADAVWEALPGSLALGQELVRNEGIAAIREAAIARRRNGTSGPDAGMMHMVTSSVITVEGDTATGDSCFILVRGDLSIGVAARYHDSFRRDGGQWRVARRTVGRR
jgi:hypothetical protein